MRRLLLAMIAIGSACALSAQTEPLEGNPSFQPAQARSVIDILYTPCSAYGTVVLDALITETGEVKAVEVRRNTACLTQAAVQAIKQWKFTPATLAGKPIASRIPVAVTFECKLSAPNPSPLPKLVPQTPAAIQAEFQPAEVTRAASPPFQNGYAPVQGTAALEVTLSAKGEPQDVKVVRDVPPFTQTAEAVLKDWRFMPATLNGHPIVSKILLAFVSPPFVLNPSQN